MFHTIIFAGNVGREPEMRYTPAGKPVTSFSVAVSDGFGENKKTIWIRVSAWDKQAETCNQYLHKGSKVLIEGRLQFDPQTGSPRVFQRNDGTQSTSFEVNATTVRFLSSANEHGEQDHQEEAPATGDSGVPF